jgi:hypothetical protein
MSTVRRLTIQFDVEDLNNDDTHNDSAEEAFMDRFG